MAPGRPDRGDVDVDGVRSACRSATTCASRALPPARDRRRPGAVVPAAFTTHTGRDHWEVLLRARAIENQCYVVAAGQVGDHDPGRSCFGRSMVIDPWGTVSPRRPTRWASRSPTSISTGCAGSGRSAEPGQPPAADPASPTRSLASCRLRGSRRRRAERSRRSVRTEGPVQLTPACRSR